MSNPNAPTPASRKVREELAALLDERAQREKRSKASRWYGMLYPWQREFIASTRNHHESCLCAANQIGKSRTGAIMDAYHLLGDYPDDWPGHRFAHATTGWVLGYSMEKTRDLVQTLLFGKFENNAFLGGLVPADRIVDWESAGGTPNAMRTVRVKHVTGVSSIVQFWSYSQGQHAMMGDCIDWAHVDEEPRDQTIRPQVLTRTLNGDNGLGGKVHYTLTPENGKTELICQFMDTPTPSQFFMQKGWDDAPHITPAVAARMLDAYPAYQRDMRTKGIPMLGHGRIFELSEDFILCDPFPIPDHWWVINGLDFGWDHPQAHVQLVEDRDHETIYVTRAYKAKKVSAADAYSAVQTWSAGIPTAWPHDGLQHEKGRTDAVQQKIHYSRAGFDMLGQHAQWPAGGFSVESGIREISDLMAKGKFKVFRGLNDWLTEYRQYHRDENGKIVKSADDLMDATRYAYMMRRYAVMRARIGQAFKAIQFTGWG